MGGKYDNEVKCNKICKIWKEERRKEEKKEGRNSFCEISIK